MWTVAMTRRHRDVVSTSRSPVVAATSQPRRSDSLLSASTVAASRYSGRPFCS